MKFASVFVLLSTAFQLLTAFAPGDLQPGKTPAAKSVKFTTSSNICSMLFGSGNQPKARAWMRQYSNWLESGEKIRISMQVKASQVPSDKADCFIMVQALGENRKYLRSKVFAKYFPAADFTNQWKTVEYIFTMVDAKRTKNWIDGKELLITFGATATQGLFEFKDFQVKRIRSAVKGPSAVLSAAEGEKLHTASLNNPDFVYNVKFAAKTPAAAWNIQLPVIADINGYVPVLSFDFDLSKNVPTVQPRLAVDNEPVPRLDHRHLPRLLNAKNPSDGGSKNYMFSLKKLLNAERNTVVSVTSGDNSLFTLKNVKLFYKAETRPMYPDAPKIEKDALTILPGKSLRVNLYGKPFIVGENVTGVADLDKLGDDALRITRKDGKIVTHNLMQFNDDTVDFRREARIMPNGELEIFMRNYFKKTNPASIGYRFMMSADFFDNANFELRFGRGNKYNSIKGKINFGKKHYIRNIFINPQTGKIITHIQYLCIEKDGVKLVMDFTPLAVTGQCTPYCQEPQKVVNFVYKRGDKVFFDLNRRPNPEYHSYFVRIHIGEYDHYYRHGNTTTTYTTGPYLDNIGYNISFADKKGTAKVNKALFAFPWWQRIYQMPFQSAAFAPAGNADIFPGWIKQAPGGKTYIAPGKLPGSVGFFAPSGKSVYHVPVEPGIYMCSLVAGHTQKDLGPFTVKCNGEVVAENVTIPANNFRHIFFAPYVKSPDQLIRLEITGKNYAVNRLFIANTITEPEDYVWKHDFWQIKGLPEFPLAVDHLRVGKAKDMPRPPEVLGKMVSGTIPQDGKYAAAGKGVYPEPVMKALPKTKELDWAWNLRITSLGGANNETGLSYRPNEEFRKYCRTIKAAGYNAVMEQGLFWYCCYDDEARNEHIKNMRALNKILHEEGLKVFRHADGPTFNAIYKGAFNTAKASGFFPVDMGTLRAFQGGGCIINPHLRKHVMDMLVEYVKGTDCDALMIDELSVLRIGANCACEFCRKKFAEDTGFSLPMPDDQTPLFEKPGNHLNAVWMDWKLQQDGNFFNELKKRLAKVKKDVLITSYGVDFQHPIGRFQKLAPYLDVVGIEGTNHYLFANFRHLLSCRKLQAAYADEYQHSQWHLHYDDWGIALKDMGFIRYLYNAFSSLNRAGIKSKIGHPAYKDAHLDWKHWPNFRNLQPIADIGVMQQYDPYYRTDTPYMASEQFGISQLLSDRHIPHEFIAKITPERLAKFKLVFLGNITILSNKEIEMLKSYVKNGGKLVITGTFGTFDEKFVNQSSSRYTELTGVEFANELLPKTALHKYNGKLINTRLAKVKNLSGKVLLKLADGTPAVIRKDYGKGFVLTTPLTPGMAAFENIIIRGKQFVAVKTAEGAALLAELLKYAKHTAYPVMISGASAKIIVESSVDTASKVINIQLMNFDHNIKYIPGKVPERVNKSDVVFHAPATPVSITIPGKVTAATALSPDYPEEHNLPVKHLSNGSSQITLEPHMLKIYTLITVKK